MSDSDQDIADDWNLSLYCRHRIWSPACSWEKWPAHVTLYHMKRLYSEQNRQMSFAFQTRSECVHNLQFDGSNHWIPFIPWPPVDISCAPHLLLHSSRTERHNTSKVTTNLPWRALTHYRSAFLYALIIRYSQMLTLLPFRSRCIKVEHLSQLCSYL